MTTPSAIGRYKRYPAYRDSGVEWLGEVPQHWKTRRLKDCARLNPESLPENSPPSADLLYIDIGSVNERGEIVQKEILTFARAPSRARRLVRGGDVIVSTVRAYLRAIALISAPEPNLVVSTGFAVVRPTPALDSTFAAYALRAPYFIDRVVASSVGVSYPAINESELGTFRIAFPPRPEQCEIAAFLSREITKIDMLIAEHEHLLGLLEERRRAIIERVVLRGVHSTIRKDSGVRWLGQIPIDWDTQRIKWVAKLESGHTPDKKVEAYWRNGDIPWISLADTDRLRSADYVDRSEVCTTRAGLANSSAHLLSPGTVIFSRDATIGLCAILATEMAVSQHFIGWVCGTRILPEYLLFVLRVMTPELERLTMGATVKTIGMPDVKELVTPIPPIAQQRQIVEHVRAVRAQADRLVSEVRAAIDQLHAYRSAMISAAVTGKIDVREEVA